MIGGVAAPDIDAIDCISADEFDVDQVVDDACETSEFFVTGYQDVGQASCGLMK